MALRPLLIVAAHCDDEVLFASCALRSRSRAVWLLHTTDSSPRDGRDAAANGFANRAAYRRARSAECTAALALAGLDHLARLCLEYPDGESIDHVEMLTSRVLQLVERSGASTLMTHAYEGGHPDHDTAALAAALAASRARRPVRVIEFAGYHWAAGSLRSGHFAQSRGGERRLPVLGAARELKRRMLACYATQAETLAALAPGDERYRPQPAYDFTRPPHDGLCYGWWPDGAARASSWRRRAARSLEEMACAGS